MFKSTIKYFFLFCTLASYSQTGKWTWVRGDTILGSLGNYGIKGLPSSTNEPPARYESIEWTDAQGNFWVYGGEDAAGTLCDLWRYNPITNIWTWVSGDSIHNFLGVYGTQGVSSPTNSPPSSSVAISWSSLDGDLWMFSGYGNFCNTLWRYNISSNQWTWMKGDTANCEPVYGIKGISSVFNTPGYRLETSCSWVDNVGNLWLFGGDGKASGFSSGYLNDLWKYNTITNEWTWISGDSIPNIPSVYGTLGVASINNTPGGRYVYASWKDNLDNFWLFGGAYFTFENKNDLWKFNPLTNEWTWMNGSSLVNQTGSYGIKGIESSSNFPGARYETRSRWTDACGDFWLYGGHGGGFFNDLWKYNVSNGKWTWVSGDTLNWYSPPIYGTMGVASYTNKPGGRQGANAFRRGNELWLFGGFTSDPSAWIPLENTLWKFTPDSVCSGGLSIAENVATEDYYKIYVYPNPSKGFFNIESRNKNGEIGIYNLVGQKIYSSKITNYITEINLSQLPSGIYMIVVQSNNIVLSEKLIKE